MSLTQSLAAINSFLRTVLGFVVAGAVGFGTWFGYKTWTRYDAALLTLEQQEVQLTQLRGDLAAKQLEVDRLDMALRLSRVDQRVARIDVLDQQPDPATGRLRTRLAFVEVSDDQQPLDDPREFAIDGEVVYVDYWVVKFEDRYVDEADLERGTSIALFRRLFGERQQPQDGFELDQVGARPKAYGRGAPLSDFERRIWDDFWRVANDPELAGSLGIRAAHGEAVSLKLQPGKRYWLELRSSGGLSVRPPEVLPAKSPGA